MPVFTVLAWVPGDCGGVSDQITDCYGSLPAKAMIIAGILAVSGLLAHAGVTVAPVLLDTLKGLFQRLDAPAPPPAPGTEAPTLGAPPPPPPATGPPPGQARPSRLPGVQRLPSGRMPANYKYAGKLYDDPRRWTPALAAKYPAGVSFTPDGFPDFSPYAIRTVRIVPTFDGDRTDFAKADRAAGLTGSRPEGYTWHHHQDRQTMLLVPSEIHDAVRHAGGVAIMKGMR